MPLVPGQWPSSSEIFQALRADFSSINLDNTVYASRPMALVKYDKALRTKRFQFVGQKSSGMKQRHRARAQKLAESQIRLMSGINVLERELIRWGAGWVIGLPTASSKFLDLCDDVGGPARLISGINDVHYKDCPSAPEQWSLSR